MDGDIDGESLGVMESEISIDGECTEDEMEVEEETDSVTSFVKERECVRRCLVLDGYVELVPVIEFRVDDFSALGELLKEGDSDMDGDRVSVVLRVLVGPWVIDELASSEGVVESDLMMDSESVVESVSVSVSGCVPVPEVLSV